MKNAQETSIDLLERFLPAGTFGRVAPFFQQHAIHLTLTHDRRSVLGDYRAPQRRGDAHRISVNANLNPYSFLITLLHEIAHLLTFEHFGSKASPHGQEWKTQFRHILIPFMGQRFFPKDVEAALHAYLHNPAASTCTDPRLYKALYRHDARPPGYKLVDDVAPNGHFRTADGRVFQKLEALRTRARCREVHTGKLYLFQGIVEVQDV